MLTEDMSRLCAEIVAQREQRGALREELESGSKNRRHAVAGLCEQMHRARAGMARRARGDRAAFLRHLRREVHAAQRAMQTDLAGVRRAWLAKAG